MQRKQAEMPNMDTLKWEKEDHKSLVNVFWAQRAFVNKEAVIEL